MIVKRIGNDVYLTWEINNNDGSPVDFSDIIDMKVYIRRLLRNKLYEQNFEVTGNVIKLHYIAEEQAGIGSYDLLAKWTKADPEVEGGIASFAVDYKNAFKLIGFGETVPDQQDETFSSNIYEAIKGDKGDSSYQTWLDAGNTGTEADYLAWIRQPATDIEQVVSSNETDRASSEGTRQLNETARVEAETLRGSAETQRISDENTRKSNETGRVNAEALRLSAEEERGTAEGLRVSSETSRSTAEGQRATAETAREAAEGIRDSNEIDRINAEGIRDANETDRINAESDRADAEVLREQAEAAREEAEDLRQTNTTTAIRDANDATTAANTAAGLATEAATTANAAAGNANSAATAANTAAGLAATATTEANTARDEANLAATAANTAAGEANTAATVANTAAGLADTARLAIQDDLASKADQTELDQLAGVVSDSTEKAGAASLAELNARLLALEKIVSSSLRSTIEVTKEFNVWGKTNLILYGAGANAKAPDFIGQKYIDTTGGNVYVAVGTTSAGNWKLV